MTKPFLLSFSLCLLLFSSACLAERPDRLSECQLDRLNALEPDNRVESEGGVTETWNSNHPELRCAGVAFEKHTIEPQGLHLPSYTNYPELIMIVQGKGVLGISVPGCTETFEEPQQSQSRQGHRRRSSRSQSQEQEQQDSHQKIRHFREGDIIAIPPGIPYWTYNYGDQKLVAINLLDTTNLLNQLDPNPRRFYLAGNPEEEHPETQEQQGQLREQHQGAGGRRRGKHQQEQEEEGKSNVLSGFDRRFMTQALNVDEEIVNRLQNPAERMKQIVRVRRGLSIISPEWQEEEEEQESRQRGLHGQREERGEEEEEEEEEDEPRSQEHRERPWRRHRGGQQGRRGRHGEEEEEEESEQGGRGGERREWERTTRHKHSRGEGEEEEEEETRTRERRHQGRGRGQQEEEEEEEQQGRHGRHQSEQRRRGRGQEREEEQQEGRRGRQGGRGHRSGQQREEEEEEQQGRHGHHQSEQGHRGRGQEQEEEEEEEQQEGRRGHQGGRGRRPGQQREEEEEEEEEQQQGRRIRREREHGRKGCKQGRQQEEEEEQYSRERRHKGGWLQKSGNGLEETICTARLQENIAKPSRADLYNPRAGRISTVNSLTLPILRWFQLSAEYVNLYRNGIYAPHWNINANSVIYVTRGRGRVQVVNCQGNSVFNDELRRGQLLVVPQNFVVAHQAGDEGFEFIAFKTNDQATTSPLKQVFRGIPAEVLANAFGLRLNQVSKLKYNGNQSPLVSPQSESEDHTLVKVA